MHDIGKNLVDIILTNNGYTVYNLGIKQPIQHILDAAQRAQGRRDRHVAACWSSRTVVMRENLEELNAAA